MKTCAQCKAEKSEDEFPRRTYKGKPITGSWCKACHRKYGREYGQRRAKLYAAGVLAPEWEGRRHRCAQCRLELPVSEFYAQRGRPICYCKQCHYKYQHSAQRGAAYKIKRNARQNERRKEAVAKVAKIKSDKGCAKCGERHPACLEFHHLDPSVKGFNLAEAPTRVTDPTRILAEMAKCIVLCSNCHRKLHYEAKNGSG
jgi:hypothetical protein